MSDNPIPPHDDTPNTTTYDDMELTSAILELHRVQINHLTEKTSLHATQLEDTRDSIQNDLNEIHTRIDTLDTMIQALAVRLNQHLTAQHTTNHGQDEQPTANTQATPTWLGYALSALLGIATTILITLNL